jgi:hypothetical protein
MNDNIAGMYEKKTGKPAEHWRGLMDAETWFTADEAKAEGLADAVYVAAPAKAAGRQGRRLHESTTRSPTAPAMLLGLTPSNSPAPEDSQRSDPPPATTKETQLMAEASTQAAPAQNPAAGTDPVTLAGQPPAPAPPRRRPRTSRSPRLRNAQAAGYVEQGRKQGRHRRRPLDAGPSAQGHRDACPGKPQMALNAILRGRTRRPSSSRSTRDAPRNRPRKIAEAKDLRSSGSNALLATGGTPASR